MCNFIVAHFYDPATYVNNKSFCGQGLVIVRKLYYSRGPAQYEMVTFPMVHCINPCIELYIGVKLCILTSDLLSTVYSRGGRTQLTFINRIDSPVLIMIGYMYSIIFKPTLYFCLYESSKIQGSN